MKVGSDGSGADSDGIGPISKATEEGELPCEELPHRAPGVNLFGLTRESWVRYCNATPYVALMSDHLSFQSRVARDRILELLEDRLDALPILATVGAQIVSLDRDTGSFAEELRELALQDPPLSFRLLRLTREFGDVKTVGEALDAVGANRLAEAVLSLPAASHFKPATANQRDLWMHALQVASLASTTAELCPDAGVDPGEAYLVGLLHDIGHFVMFHVSPRHFDDVGEWEWSSGHEVLQHELELCGIDHSELGWRASLQWEIPEPAVSLIRSHHDYEATLPLEMETLMSILRLADATSFLMMNEPSWVQRSLPELTVGIRQNLNLAGGFRFPFDVKLFAGQVRMVDATVSPVIESLFP